MKHPARKMVSLTVVSLAFGGCHTRALRAQATLPATAPTTTTASQLPSANPVVTHGAANIQWDGHLLRITANGESLDDVLNQVASRAGIRISGSAPSDRIYGTYGPAPLVDVLSDLVSGLPVNMLFVDRAGTLPPRLTFTARNGAATPASPSTAYAQQPPPATFPESNPTPPQQANAPAANPGVATPFSPGSASGTAADPSASANQPAAGSGNPQSPNGVKTPQEIFEQLQRMRANAGAQH